MNDPRLAELALSLATGGSQPDKGDGLVRDTNGWQFKPIVQPSDKLLWPNGTMLDPDTGQIAFPAAQNPSADPHVLDDYEEGTWVPDLGGTTTYAFRSGFFTKIGNIVIFSGLVQVALIGTGSKDTFGGLPFSCPNVTPGYIGSISGTANLFIWLTGQISGTNFAIQGTNAAANGTSVIPILGNGTLISFGGSYLI